MGTMNAQFFLHELNKLHIKKKLSSTRAYILCPFHNEKTPSGGVSLDPKFPGSLGRFKCWGCGKTASWNELAKILGMKKLNGKQAVPDNTGYIDVKAMRGTVLPKDEKEDLKDFDFFDLQEDWRGFEPEFLQKVCGAKLVYHDWTQHFFVWLPVRVRGKEVGYIRGHMRRPEEGPTYLNKPGDWVLKKGLFPFDYAIELMKRKGLKTIVLVEGPRDALRMLRAGIPSVCIMGTNNWTDKKRHLLEMAGVERILLMMDGDKAGKKATFKIHPTIKMAFEVKVFRLWKTAAELGLDKLDPNNAPKEVVKRAKELLV